MRVAPVIAAVLLALSLSVAPAVDAASVVYTDANNVWTASPDGAVKKQVTSDGTADVPWVAASQADTGMILAFRKAGSTSSMTYMSADGTVIRSGLTPVTDPGWPTCEVAVIGPLHSRLNPAGTLATYDFFCNRGVFYGWSSTPNTVVASTNSVSTIGALFLYGWNPTFIPNSTGPGEVGERLLVTDELGSGSFLYKEMAPPGGDKVIWPDVGGSVWSADVSRDGSRVAVDEITAGATQSALFVYGMSAPLWVGAGWTSGCRVPTGPNPSRPSLSPDGTMLAWADDQGAKVIPLTSIAGSAVSPPACGVGPVTVLSATGMEPVFSAAAAPSPAGQASGAAPAVVIRGLAITAPASASRRAIRSRGLTVSTRCAAACIVRATMKAGSRVVARGTRRLKKAGVARVRLRGAVPRTAKTVTITVTTGSATGIKVVRVTG